MIASPGRSRSIRCGQQGIHLRARQEINEGSSEALILAQSASCPQRLRSVPVYSLQAQAMDVLLPAVLQDDLKRCRQHYAARAASPYLFASRLGNRVDGETFIEDSILCLARSACEAKPGSTSRLGGPQS